MLKQCLDESVWVHASISTSDIHLFELQITHNTTLVISSLFSLNCILYSACFIIKSTYGAVVFFLAPRCIFIAIAIFVYIISDLYIQGEKHTFQKYTLSRTRKLSYHKLVCCSKSGAFSCIIRPIYAFIRMFIGVY